MINTFHEGDFYSEFKYIRNQFRKFNSYSLLVHCFGFLYKKIEEPFREIEKKQPWQVLLLIKWILKDNNFSLPNRRKATRKDFFKILNLVRELGNKVRMPNEYDHWHLFFRNISYQQFIYQFRFNVNAFSRQKLLFTELEENHYIKSVFREKTGIEVNQFIELSVFLLTNQIDKTKSISKSFFSPLLSHYKPEIIEKYLRCLSFNVSEAREYVLSLEGNNVTSYEYHEQTPFIKRPLLKVGNKYYPYYRNILYRGLEYYIYDCVREENPQKFMQRFGKLFEGYVESNLRYCDTSFISENELKSIVGNRSKVVDFLIEEDGKSILLDAKGVEMNYLGKVSHRSNVVKKTVKASIVKGVEQGYELIYNLRKSGSDIVSKNNNDHYLIIVTFKEMYMGNGKVFSTAIAPDFVKSLLNNYEGEYLIPLENIYFLPIDSLELWVEMIA